MFARKLGFSSLLATLCLSLTACPPPKAYKKIEDDMVVYSALKDIQAKDENAMSEQKKQVYNALRSEQPVSFQVITELWKLEQITQYNTQVNIQGRLESDRVIPQDYNYFLNSIISVNQVQALVSDPNAMKVEYEKGIEAFHGGERTAYDRSSVTTPFLLKDNSLQCYSGTVTQQLVARKLRLEPYRTMNSVVVFTPGHMLPASMKKTTEGYELVGIETIASGPAPVVFGNSSELQNSGLCMRVVDAELFAVIELFKHNIDNPIDVMKATLEATAEKFGIDLDGLESSITSNCPTMVGFGGTSGSSIDVANSSIFSIPGGTPPAEGRFERNEITEPVKMLPSGGFAKAENGSSISVLGGVAKPHVSATPIVEESDELVLLRNHNGPIIQIPASDAGNYLMAEKEFPENAVFHIYNNIGFLAYENSGGKKLDEKEALFGKGVMAFFERGFYVPANNTPWNFGSEGLGGKCEISFNGNEGAESKLFYVPALTGMATISLNNENSAFKIRVDHQESHLITEIQCSQVRFPGPILEKLELITGIKLVLYSAD